MIQDFDESVDKISKAGGLPNGNTFVPRLSETVFAFGQEVNRDLKVAQWRNQYEAGLNAGYILCLLGRAEEGVKLLREGVHVHQQHHDKYSDAESVVLGFAVQTMKEFGVDAATIKDYETKLAAAVENETETPADWIRKIRHHEADMECATGDLDAAYSYGRREQGLLQQKLGDYEGAITSFRRAIAEDKRDWQSQTSIKNTLSIVESFLGLNQKDAALAEFLGLMDRLVPRDIKMGDPLPDLFRSNFFTLQPFLEKLGLEASLESIAKHAEARMVKIQPKEHQDRAEITILTEILAAYYVSKGDYAAASTAFENGRKHLEYKHHLCRREQAEFAIKAGDPRKAQELIRQDTKDNGVMGGDHDKKVFELTSLDLQLGEFSRALDRLDQYCTDYKASLLSGSYGSIFEVRHAQIQILKGVIGPEYVQKVREFIQGKGKLPIQSGIKLLPVPKDPKREADEEDD